MVEPLLLLYLRTTITLFFLSIVVFFGMHVGPRTPTASIGVDLAEERRLSVGGDFSFRSELLGDYFSWMSGVVQGDLGESASYHEPIGNLLIYRAQPSLVLVAISLAIAFPIGLFITCLSIRRPRSVTANVTVIASVIGTAIPVFFLGLLSLFAFRGNETLLPESGFDSLEPLTMKWAIGLTLPVAALSTPITAAFVRFVRIELLRTATLNSTRTALGKGLPESRLLLNHQLRPILAPILSTIPIMTLHIVGGLIAIELIFDIPGLGNLTWEAAGRRDFAVLHGVVLIAGCSAIFMGLLTKHLGILFDVRLRSRRISTEQFPCARSDRTFVSSIRTRSWQRHRVTTVLLAVWLLIIVTTPAFFDLDPTEFSFEDRFRSPDKTHLLGTDDQGRDIFIRTIFGVRHAFVTGSVVTVFVLVVGLCLGILAGSHQFVREIVFPFLGAIRALPPILFVLALLVIHDTKNFTLLVALSLSMLPCMVEGVAICFRQCLESGFVEATRACGSGQSRIVCRHILPACGEKALELAAGVFTTVLITEATISFLGFNPRPELISLGEMISYSRVTMTTAPWTLFSPALALAGSLLLLQRFGRGLRDEMQPEFHELLPSHRQAG